MGGAQSRNRAGSATQDAINFLEKISADSARAGALTAAGSAFDKTIIPIRVVNYSAKVSSADLTKMLAAVNIAIADFCRLWGLALHRTTHISTYNPTDTTDTSPVAFLLDDAGTNPALKTRYNVWMDYASWPGLEGFHTSGTCKGTSCYDGGTKTRINIFIMCEKLCSTSSGSSTCSVLTGGTPAKPAKSISMILSNECFEALADGFLNKFAISRGSTARWPILGVQSGTSIGSTSSNLMYQLETGDPVGQGNIISINGVYISDFILPAWTNPESTGPWSYSGMPGVRLLIGEPLSRSYDVGSSGDTTVIDLGENPSYMKKNRDGSKAYKFYA